MVFRTGDQTLVKAINRSIVLNLLRQQAPLSRADIARTTGLNKATVSALIDELLGEHLVEEVGVGTGRVGRRPRLLRLNRGAGFVLGGEIGVDFLNVTVLDLTGQVVWKVREQADNRRRPVETMARLAELMAEAAARQRDTPRGLLGIGIGVPGLVDQERGVLLYAPNLRWEDVAVGPYFAERFGVPVQVENEANAGAMAEAWCGVARGTRHAVYYSVGIGVGTGIIIQGELVRGSGGMAGEIGHTTVDVTGPRCACGNRGCLEVYASEAALRRFYQQLAGPQAADRGRHARGEEAADGRPNGAAGTDDTPPSTHDIVEAAKGGDAAATAALNRVATYLGVSVANAINTFNPDMVIIGGPLVEAGRFILEPIRQIATERALPLMQRRTRIVLAECGPDACAIGAGVMALQDLFRVRVVTG